MALPVVQGSEGKGDARMADGGGAYRGGDEQREVGGLPVALLMKQDKLTANLVFVDINRPGHLQILLTICRVDCNAILARSAATSC